MITNMVQVVCELTLRSSAVCERLRTSPPRPAACNPSGPADNRVILLADQRTARSRILATFKLSLHIYHNHFITDIMIITSFSLLSYSLHTRANTVQIVKHIFLNLIFVARIEF